MKFPILSICFIIVVFTLNVNQSYSLPPIHKTALLNIKDNKGIINVCLGTNSNCLPFKVSLELGVSFVLNGIYYKDGFQWQISESFKTIERHATLTYQSKQLTGSYVNDYFRIDHFQFALYDLTFFLVDDGLLDFDISGVLGLGIMNNTIPNSSFMQLAASSSGLINNAFFLSLNKNSHLTNIEEDFIQFGIDKALREEYIPLKYTYNKAKVCSFNDLQSSLINCKLHSVIFFRNDGKDKDNLAVVFKAQSYIAFNNESNKIICPASYFYLLKETVFKSQLESQQCSTSFIPQDNTEIIYCNHFYNIDSFNGEFTFVIGKWSIKIPFIELFQYKGANAPFLIIKAPNYNDEWIFGNFIFNYFDVIVDYDNSSVYLRLKGR